MKRRRIAIAAALVALAVPAAASANVPIPPAAVKAVQKKAGYNWSCTYWSTSRMMVVCYRKSTPGRLTMVFPSRCTYLLRTYVYIKALLPDGWGLYETRRGRSC